ncbi:hypothetical protein QP027_03865 [Corynebacterium breve]|uniref:Uncharacterized protein n=1 Tax=Corynebacterium breve TaxID=3049799 RepID=A0ABY8VLV9_9CORY|nr:hypothetical protein [Corynebacterium breve]WIM68540.1 hypothetical protein QP027_03865 [Corynebacterium breve]
MDTNNFSFTGLVAASGAAEAGACGPDGCALEAQDKPDNTPDEHAEEANT